MLLHHDIVGVTAVTALTTKLRMHYEVHDIVGVKTVTVLTMEFSA